MATCLTTIAYRIMMERLIKQLPPLWPQNGPTNPQSHCCDPWLVEDNLKTLAILDKLTGRGGGKDEVLPTMDPASMRHVDPHTFLKSHSLEHMRANASPQAEELQQEMNKLSERLEDKVGAIGVPEHPALPTAGL
ncbi:hypothetical protein HO133_000078 [Letharia lupina]|uniref:Uncharacterized protein n=1 Tax=Letharia lupina TaxID=560253 RepID=A0A8H6FCQ2_9LECA|nr:uncharacterized protein HO133_000078 [Letharia lupina]KAF6223236.1 hypothetical protein HO133_000078 [Letharia lupina]